MMQEDSEDCLGCEEDFEGIDAYEARVEMSDAEYEAQMAAFHRGEIGEYYTKDGQFFAGIYRTDPEVQRRMDEVLMDWGCENENEFSIKGSLLIFIFIVALLLLASFGR